MKPERAFRTRKIDPFLRGLPRTKDFSIQSAAIRGIPDKIVCIDGQFVALEIKAEFGKVSGSQEVALDDVEKAGGVSLVASPDNWEFVKEILIELSRGYEVKHKWRKMFAEYIKVRRR